MGSDSPAITSLTRAYSPEDVQPRAVPVKARKSLPTHARGPNQLKKSQGTEEEEQKEEKKKEEEKEEEEEKKEEDKK